MPARQTARGVAEPRRAEREGTGRAVPLVGPGNGGEAVPLLPPGIADYEMETETEVLAWQPNGQPVTPILPGPPLPYPQQLGLPGSPHHLLEGMPHPGQHLVFEGAQDRSSIQRAVSLFPFGDFNA